ncbi:MAG: hypothetical protein H7222_11125 [Methylotenera sp.]|nr:hypothetical protein [Oligoflexia bacterium]
MTSAIRIKFRGHFRRIYGSGILLLLSSTAMATRLDEVGQYFYQNSNGHYDQGGMKTCYAYAAAGLLGEYLTRTNQFSPTFRISGMGLALQRALLFGFHDSYATCDSHGTNIDPMALFNPSEGALPTSSLIELDGGSTHLAAAAGYVQGEVLNYAELEGKFASKGAFTAKGGVWGSAFGDTVSKCRNALAKLISEKTLTDLSALAVRPAVTATVAGTCLDSTNSLGRQLWLAEVEWKHGAFSGRPYNNRDDAQRNHLLNLVVKYKSPYSSIYKVLKSFASARTITPSSSVKFKAYYSKSDGTNARKDRTWKFDDDLQHHDAGSRGGSSVNYLVRSPAQLIVLIKSKLNMTNPTPVGLSGTFTAFGNVDSIANYYRANPTDATTRDSARLNANGGPVPVPLFSHAVILVAYRTTPSAGFLMRNTWTNSVNSFFRSSSLTVDGNNQFGDYWVNEGDLMLVFENDAAVVTVIE